MNRETIRDLLMLIGTIALILIAVNSFADVYVSGYTKSNGTYVAPHYRSSPNSTTSDNWSTKGNTNPYTGESGTQSIYRYDNSSRSSGYGVNSGKLTSW